MTAAAVLATAAPAAVAAPADGVPPGVVTGSVVPGAGAPAAVAVAADKPPMPDFRGKGLMTVFNNLDYRTKVHVKDISGYDRNVLWPLSWKVCTQSPKPGAKLAAHAGDQSVDVGVVKKIEKCPK